MDLTTRTNPDTQYQVVAPIFFNNEVVGILDGKYVQGSVARRTVTDFRIERRTSFKHPVIGLLLGVAMIGVPLQALARDPLGLWWLTLASPMRLVGSFFMLYFGVYLLWGVLRRRDEPWLVFTTDGGERAFPLRAELPEHVATVLRSLIAPKAKAGT